MSTLPALSLDEAARLVASPGAFAALSAYLTPEAVAADSRSANAVLLKLAGTRRRDPRWRAVLLPLLNDVGLLASVEYAIGRDPSPEARDALLACVQSGRSATAAATLGAVGDPRALPYLLDLLDRDTPGVHVSRLLPALDYVIDGSAVGALERWIARHPTQWEAKAATVLLKKAKAIAAGKPLPPPPPPDFEGFVPKLVGEAKKAVRAFRKANPGARVCAFAYDADPYNEFFAACFDDAARTGARDETEVGNYRWHLFHEFELPVSKKLPKDGVPPSPSVHDGYVEHFFRPILQRACEQAVAEGVFEPLAIERPFTVGYGYHSEELRIVATVG